MLLSMGKENLFVWEMEPGMVHENDAAERLAALCGRENMTWSETKEGKIELKSAIEGVFLVDSARLFAVNSIDELMIATRRGGGTVHPGDKLAGTRVIPLIIREEKLRQAEQAAGSAPLLSVRPFVRRTAAVITTGSEVAKGRIPDSFTPVVERKLAAFGIRMTEHILVEDGQENVLEAIEQMKRRPVDMILCTGGMSVDPDDSTPGAIKAKRRGHRDLRCAGAAGRNVPARLLRRRPSGHGTARLRHVRESNDLRSGSAAHCGGCAARKARFRRIRRGRTVSRLRKLYLSALRLREVSMVVTAKVITVSDRSYRGEREDAHRLPIES